MKRLVYLIILILFFISTKDIYAYNFDNTIKVYDYAQVLTEKQENKLIESVKEYINKHNIDMVIITVRYYSYDSINDYINKFYNKNKFGIGTKKSGIILAIDTKDNKVGIETFGVARTLYSESEIKDMILSIEKKDKYYNKLLDFIKKSKYYINEEDDSYYKDDVLKSTNWVLMLLISIFIPTVVVIAIFIKLRKKEKQNVEICYIVENLIINKREDKFLTTHTKQVNNK